MNTELCFAGQVAIMIAVARHVSSAHVNEWVFVPTHMQGKIKSGWCIAGAHLARNPISVNGIIFVN